MERLLCSTLSRFWFECCGNPKAAKDHISGIARIFGGEGRMKI